MLRGIPAATCRISWQFSLASCGKSMYCFMLFSTLGLFFCEGSRVLRSLEDNKCTSDSEDGVNNVANLVPRSHPREREKAWYTHCLHMHNFEGVGEYSLPSPMDMYLYP